MLAIPQIQNHCLSPRDCLEIVPLSHLQYILDPFFIHNVHVALKCKFLCNSQMQVFVSLSEILVSSSHKNNAYTNVMKKHLGLSSHSQPRQ